jgi:hypothetical protein
MLTITGSSFGGQPEDYEILADGHACSIQSISFSEI